MAYPLDQENATRPANAGDKILMRSSYALGQRLYLTNYWTMKGYDLAIFPREESHLLVIEPQFREAQLTA